MNYIKNYAIHVWYYGFAEDSIGHKFVFEILESLIISYEIYYLISK
jgi:hypothetical protein